MLSEWGAPLDGNPPRQRRNNLKEEVVDYVRELIFSGQLRPGAKIDQDRLAHDLDVSKLPVREALILLESEGLVINYPRRGAFVEALTPDDIYDHYIVFGLVSSAAAERAAERITDEEIEQLATLVDHMANWDSPERAEGQESLNSQFHAIINRAGGSRRLRSVLRSLANAIPDRLYHETRGWTDSARREHEEIVQALRERDGARAGRAVMAHITSGAQYAVDRLRAGGFWDDAPPSA